MFDLLLLQVGIFDSCDEGCGAGGVPRVRVCAKGKEKADEFGVAEPGCAVEDAVALPSVRGAGGDGTVVEDFDDV
jgi:hypothetical protein